MKTNLLLIVLLCSLFRISGAQNTDSTIVCKADFDYYIDPKIMTFAPALVIQFKDLSVGNVVKWAWTFSHSPDSVSTEQNPLHIFNSFYPGLYDSSFIRMLPPIYAPTACLQIETSDGCVSRICKSITFIHDSVSPPTPGCYVQFKAFRNDTIATVPEVVPYSFIADAPNNVIRWQWNFGDSTTSNESNPVHLYPFQTSAYMVCLTITTSDNCTNSSCFYVFVGKQDSTIVPSCNAAYSYHNLDYDPRYWLFQDNSSGNPTAWFWDFGDGTSSNLQNPPLHFFRRDTIPDSLGNYHIVHSNGIFKVCLTTLSGNSCKSMYCDYVNTNYSFDSTYVKPCGNLINLVSSNILGSAACKAKATASLIDSIGNLVLAGNYYWSNGSTTESAYNLCPNTTYYIVITSENGCKTAGSFAIMDYTQPYNLYGYWTVNGSGSAYNFNYTLPADTLTCSWVFSDGTIKEGDKVSYFFASPDSSNSVTVILKDPSGNAVYTQKINLGRNSPVGIKQTIASSLNIYPNPVMDELKITIPGEFHGIIKIEVYDALGRIMRTKQVDVTGNSELRLNTSTLPSGFYIVSLSSGGSRLGIAKFTK